LLLLLWLLLLLFAVMPDTEPVQTGQTDKDPVHELQLTTKQIANVVRLWIFQIKKQTDTVIAGSAPGFN
jgi:hypothetical protein